MCPLSDNFGKTVKIMLPHENQTQDHKITNRSLLRLSCDAGWLNTNKMLGLSLIPKLFGPYFGCIIKVAWY